MWLIVIIIRYLLLAFTESKANLEYSEEYPDRCRERYWLSIVGCRYRLSIIHKAYKLIVGA